jgi:hypothetical protein
MGVCKRPQIRHACPPGRAGQTSERGTHTFPIEMPKGRKFSNNTRKGRHFIGDLHTHPEEIPHFSERRGRPR